MIKVDYTNNSKTKKFTLKFTCNDTNGQTPASYWLDPTSTAIPTQLNPGVETRNLELYKIDLHSKFNQRSKAATKIWKHIRPVELVIPSSINKDTIPSSLTILNMDKIRLITYVGSIPGNELVPPAVHKKTRMLLKLLPIVQYSTEMTARTATLLYRILNIHGKLVSLKITLEPTLKIQHQPCWACNTVIHQYGYRTFISQFEEEIKKAHDTHINRCWLVSIWQYSIKTPSHVELTTCIAICKVILSNQPKNLTLILLTTNQYPFGKA